MQSTSIIPFETIDLDDLLSCDNLRTDYKKNNKERLALITLIEIICNRIKEIKTADPRISRKKLKYIALGAWFYCIDSIAIKYRLLNPEFKESIFFNSGSTLYKLFLKKLGITKQNAVSEKDKLKYINKFQKYFFRGGINPDQLLAFTSDLEGASLRYEALQQNTINLMQHIYVNVAPYANQLLKAIPLEQVLNFKLQNLYRDYMAITIYDNPERQFLAQFAYAIGSMGDDVETEDDFIPRTLRIKLGFIFYVMQSIADTYHCHLLRSPRGNSDLYDLCCEMLNGNDLADISASTRHLCLSTFMSYIRSNKNRRRFEKEIFDHFKEVKIIAPQIDSKLFQIEDKLQPIIRNLDPANKPILSKSTITALALGAILASAPGYGVGYSFGFMAGMTDELSAVKTKLIKPMSGILTVVMNDSAKNFGYFTADVIVNSTVERAFAKIFETLSMILGALGCGGLKIVLYDLTFKTLVDLAKLTYLLYQNLPEKNLLNEKDIEFIRLLVDLPEEVFSQEKKDHLNKLIFTPNEFALFSPSVLAKQQEHREVKNEVPSDDEEFCLVPN